MVVRGTDHLLIFKKRTHDSFISWQRYFVNFRKQEENTTRPSLCLLLSCPVLSCPLNFYPPPSLLWGSHGSVRILTGKTADLCAEKFWLSNRQLFLLFLISPGLRVLEAFDSAVSYPAPTHLPHHLQTTPDYNHRFPFRTIQLYIYSQIQFLPLS
jgi:hypothetical protein